MRQASQDRLNRGGYAAFSLLERQYHQSHWLFYSLVTPAMMYVGTCPFSDNWPWIEQPMVLMLSHIIYSKPFLPDHTILATSSWGVWEIWDGTPSTRWTGYLLFKQVLKQNSKRLCEQLCRHHCTSPRIEPATYAVAAWRSNHLPAHAW